MTELVPGRPPASGSMRVSGTIDEEPHDSETMDHPTRNQRRGSALAQPDHVVENTLGNAVLNVTTRNKVLQEFRRQQTISARTSPRPSVQPSRSSTSRGK